MKTGVKKIAFIDVGAELLIVLIVVALLLLSGYLNVDIDAQHFMEVMFPLHTQLAKNIPLSLGVMFLIVLYPCKDTVTIYRVYNYIPKEELHVELFKNAVIIVYDGELYHFSYLFSHKIDKIAEKEKILFRFDYNYKKELIKVCPLPYKK
jgi:hypothetical protein